MRRLTCDYFVGLFVIYGLALTLVMSALTPQDDWGSFKQRFNKTYRDQKEEAERRAIWQTKLDLIRTHNQDAAAGKYNYTIGENLFSDWTDEEYRKLLGYRSQRSSANNKSSRTRRSARSPVPPYMPIYSVTDNDLPATVNWTERGWVGPVTNQGNCGSCWAYSATGSLESQYYNCTGQMVEMSQQNLIDCSYPEGNEGCDGGNVQQAYWYIQMYGIDSLSSYPDVSQVTGNSTGVCHYSTGSEITTIASWRNVEYGNELALQQAVALVGPVSVAIDAESIKFQLYTGGVYSNNYCCSDISCLDHAVLVVGYGTYEGIAYWLVQNSWGTSWGINGYFMLARNANNMCGVATDATFPVVKQSTCVMCDETYPFPDAAANPPAANPPTAAPPAAAAAAAAVIGSSPLQSIIFFAAVFCLQRAQFEL